MRSSQGLISSTAINTLLVVLLACAALAQFLIRLDSDNLACVCIVVSSSLITLGYLRWTSSLATHPLSTFAVFGFCISTQAGALLIQSMAWTPLNYELRQPIRTFAILAMFQMVMLSAHAVYRVLPLAKAKEDSLLRGSMRAAGFYAVPPIAMLWLFGLIGFISHFGGGTVDGNNVSVIARAISGLRFLVYAPFLMPIYLLQEGPAYCNPKKHYPFLLLYFFAVVLLGIAANARSVILTGITIVGLLFGLWLMRTRVVITSKAMFKALLVLAVLGCFVKPLSDLSTAVAVARTLGGPVAKNTPMQMIDKTLMVLGRPELIRGYRMREKMASASSSYDENYIANPMGARFVETKFHDNALYFSSNLSEHSQENLERVSKDKIWALLPQPVLNMLNIKVDKGDLAYSMGDYLVYLSRGVELGGLKTGSVFAEGLAIFSYTFPLIYFLVVIVLFFLIDLLSFRKPSGEIVFTIPAMTRIFPIFLNGISGESMQQVIGGATRDFFQNMLIYLAVYHAARLLLSVANVNKLPSRKHALAPDAGRFGKPS